MAEFREGERGTNRARSKNKAGLADHLRTISPPPSIGERMTPEQFRYGLAISAMIGVALGAVCVAAFGIFDVQCTKEQPFWHVDARHVQGVCLPYEVATGPEASNAE